MSNQTVLTIKLTRAELTRLRNIAKREGFTIGRGAEKDWGSVQQLAKALVNGERFIVKDDPDPIPF